MPFGLLTGLGAALSWGTLDVITALASRVIGSLRVTAGMQSVSAVDLRRARTHHGHASADRPGVARGRRAARADRRGRVPRRTSPASSIGPIAVVSGVVAAYGGLTVVLSVVFRGETPDHRSRRSARRSRPSASS